MPPESIPLSFLYPRLPDSPEIDPASIPLPTTPFEKHDRLSFSSEDEEREEEDEALLFDLEAGIGGGKNGRRRSSVVSNGSNGSRGGGGWARLGGRRWSGFTWRGVLAGGMFAGLLILLGITASIWSFHSPQQNTADPVYKALRRSCAKNPWREGLYVNCTLSMGLNNLRSEFSTCLKFAFDAGAGLVLPNIVLRDNKTLNAWATEGPGVEFVRTDFYFDTLGLREDLKYWCPQMKLRDQFDTTDVGIQVKDRPRGWWELRFGKGDYRRHFDELLALNEVTTWSKKSAAIVEENGRPYAQWDYRSQPADFGQAWFDLIRWAPRLQHLADQVASNPLLHGEGGYLGVHLRLEADVLNGWSGFDQQVNAYGHYIDKRNESTIFLATGDGKWKPKFAERFPNQTIVDKWDLVTEGTELHYNLTQLTFDEIAVVDYVCMKSSNLVFGIGLSSFSYLLGVDRRVNRTGHFSDTLHMEIMPPGSPMVGDENTLLLPPILGEYYKYFP